MLRSIVDSGRFGRHAGKPALRALWAGCVALLVVVVGGCAGDAAPPQRITIGTGPGGTLYNQIGLSLTSLAQAELGVPSTARPFTGSSVYLPQLDRGDLGYGINTAVDTAAAYLGIGAYPRPMPNLRAGMLLVRAPYQYYVRGDSEFRSIEDLRGQPIVTHFRSIASLDDVHDALLATAGLTVEDVRPVVVAGVTDAIRSLVDGRVASAATMLGIPALREADATLSDGIRILGLGKNESALDTVPGLSATTLRPGGAVMGVREPTRVAAIDVYLNVSAHVPADEVYRLIGTIHRNWATLQQGLPALRSTAPEAVLPTTFRYPFHEGAVRYFREIGLWTAEHDRIQRELTERP